MQALTTFAAVDTVFTVGLLSQIASHSNLLPEQHRLAYLGAIGLFATVPPLLLGVLRWIRTRLVTSLSEEAGPDGEVLVVMGFPSLLPGSSAVGSTLSFRAEDLRTEYDGGASARARLSLAVTKSALTPDAAGVAYIEARPEGGEGVSYVLDPIEMSRVWGDEARARELLAALNGFGVRSG